MDTTQLSLFDLVPTQIESMTNGSLNIVKAEFKNAERTGWHELFDGFDEMYGITFSSGVQFMEKVFESFEHIEIIFGCEGVLNDDLATIISAQIKGVEEIVKSKSARKIAERMDRGNIKISVSRDTKSHEKIFILRAKDGRTRVITGSANMSASAFLGIQRENIICFDDSVAFDFYKNLFDEFQDKCADSVSEKLIAALQENEDFVRDNIIETPILKTIEKKKVVILEPSEETDEAEIVANIKGLEGEIKPLIPKIKPENGKIFVTGEAVKTFKRKYEEHANVKKVKEKQLPKLHIDYENRKVNFNGKELSLNTNKQAIKNDIVCLTNFINSLSAFYGDYHKSQRDYYKFLNWYFCSPFMPYLRYIGSQTEYGVIPFPVVGILYGDSNGGKSTFINLLSKLMTGSKIMPCSSKDFTSTNISNLKAACEGVPINIDDLARKQYDAHFETVIKDDGWGILEHYINYPAVVISSNKISSLKQEISKRVVTCRIDIKIDKESGAYNSKKINESMNQATGALFCEYIKRMFEAIDKIETRMREENRDYFPDIFLESSNVLVEIFKDMGVNLPDYVTKFHFADYFGDLETGRHAIEQLRMAWQTEPTMFSIDKKKNKLIYSYPENGRLYELKYLQEELPPALECNLNSKSLIMKLDVAKEVFGEDFKKRIFH